MTKVSKYFFYAFLLILFFQTYASAQVINSVTYGRNRLQFKKFKWQYYQSNNFNTYFNQNGQELAKFVLQTAEEELPNIEKFTEYSLQRRVNIVVYNEYADMQQSNIGLSSNWQNTSGAAKLVNNKMVVYFNGDHAHLRKQIRAGIAKVITDNLLFGESVGEYASNQALLDLPKWLTDGYVSYTSENWNTTLDDQLKSEMLSEKYTKFYQFAFEKPELAGHAFWYYIEEKYKKENVTYFLYLARMYKDLNKASLQICKKKFKGLMAEFMEFEFNKYENDIAKRKSYPKGSAIESFEINNRKDYYRINVNPQKKNSTYAAIEFKKGLIKLFLKEEYDYTTILKYGIRNYQNETNPDYPLMAWDPKGTRLAVIYNQEGRTNLFVYDLVTRIKYSKMDLTNRFQQILDVKYMLDSRNLLLSATKNGHSDIFSLNLETEKIQQITDDVYDDLDPTFVAFPGKTGIIFASNRPTANSKGGDSVLPGKARYNIFLITNFGTKAEVNQITQLSDLKYGNARLPMPYNTNHFTFISDENGIANRYAGFFTTKAAGVDTLVVINKEFYRNPSAKEIDSILTANKKEDVDSIAVVSISKDSSYTFPISNYESNVAETRVAGENNQVSEVTRQSDEKILYKLKIDENTLRRRNITATPTAYMKRILMNEKIDVNKIDAIIKEESVVKDLEKTTDLFQNEFTADSSENNSVSNQQTVLQENFLKQAKLFNYKPVKFGTNYGGASLSNAILLNRYQPYENGSGPVSLGSGTPLNGLITLGTSELLEDISINGGFRLSTNLKENEWMLNFQNLRKRVDWGFTYYRNSRQSLSIANNKYYPSRTYSNIYQGNISYPFDQTKRITLSVGLRADRAAILTDVTAQSSLTVADVNTLFAQTHAEYVYDNSLNPTENIWNGLRYKIYFDWNTDASKEKNQSGKYNFNWGLDARYYYPIYRNFIWAGRAAAEFSWGSQKTIYYLGGIDGWLMFGSNQKEDGSQRYFNSNNRPSSDNTYAFQSIAQNLRGFIQNVANGNNYVVFNSELRLPIISTFFDRPVNTSFLKNLQVTQFIDLGTAWNGAYNGIGRPSSTYGTQPVQVFTKVGGIGPFAGGYGFGARSTLFGYFLKFDAGWPMSGFFSGKPKLYLSLGFDF